MKVTVIGVSRMSGIGKESGKPYDFAQVVYLRPMEPMASEKFSLSGYGFETGKADLALDAMDKFAKVNFPATVELEMVQEPGRQGVKSVVTGFKPVMAAAPRAA